MSRIRNLHILCIEGIKQNAEKLKEQFRRLGHTADRALDEDFAHKLLEQSVYDLITIDNRFLDPDKFKLFRDRTPSMQDTPVLLIVDSGNEDAISDILKLGVDYFLIRDKNDRYLGLISAILHKLFKNQRILNSSIQIEKALEDSEKRYRTYIEFSPIGLFIADEMGNYIDVNNAACKMLDYTRNELLSTSIIEIDKTDVKDLSKHPFSILKQTGTVTTDIKLQKKDGTLIDCLLHAVQLDKNRFMGHCIDITEHKKANLALKDSEEKYRMLVENSDSSIVLMDRQGKFEFMNHVAIEQLGDVKECYIGKSMWDCFPKTFADQHFEDLERVISTGQGVLGERETILNGISQFYRMSMQPVRDRDGCVNHALIIASNITDRVVAESALKESEKRFRDLAEMLPEAIFETDIDFNITYSNRKAVELFGVSSEELKNGYNGLNCIAPEDRPRAIKNLSKRMEGNTVGTIEYKGIKKDGTSFPILFHASSILKNGKIVGLRGIIVDITKQKQTEEKLRKIAEDYRITSEKTGQIVYDYYPETGQFFWAGAIESVTGHTPEEFQSIDKNLWKEMIHPDDRDETFKMLRNAQERCSNFDSEYRLQRKDGSYAFIEEHGVFLQNENGKSHRMVGTLKDITEKKMSENQLRELEEQFRQAQKMEAIGILAGGVAHDFNNILNVILGYSELLMEGFDENDPVYKKIENIKKNADRATNLTRQLLAFSRKQILQLTVLNMNDVIINMESLLQQLIGDNIKLSTILGKDLYDVKADSGQIEQIIMNLIVNARDAMPEGGQLIIETKNVEIDENFARVHTDAQIGKHVMLTISDTGVGMTKEVKNKIFEPFFTTKKPGKGTGLGISTVYGIVKQSGGNIWVYSEPNKGTTFKIYLPIAASKAKSKGIRVSEAKMPKQSRTVMVVEDNESMGEMISEVLELEGYTIHHIANPVDAIEFYKVNYKEIDMLLTDVVMPNMSGKQLVDALKEINPKLKVLFMSGYTDNAIVKKGVLEEGTQFIQKPFMVKDLVRKINEILNDPTID